MTPLLKTQMSQNQNVSATSADYKHFIPNNESFLCSVDMRKANISNSSTNRTGRYVENCGSYRSDQFQNKPTSHQRRRRKHSEQKLQSLQKLLEVLKKARTWFGKIGWGKVMREDYKTLEMTDSWMQNYSLKLTKPGNFQQNQQKCSLKQKKNVYFHREKRTPVSYHNVGVQRQRILQSSKGIYTNSVNNDQILKGTRRCTS